MRLPHTLSPTERRLNLGAVMLHMLGVGLTLGLTIPLTSLTLERWGIETWLIGVAGAMSPLAILCAMPFLPRLARRLGAVRAMALGCGTASAALATMYLLPTLPAWLACRFAIGAGLALPWLVGDVWINSVTEERSRGVVVACYVACLFCGFSLGPLALDAVGIEGATPFVLGVTALLLSVLPLLAVGRLAPPIEVHAGAGLFESARAVPLVAVGALLAGTTESAAFALLPIWGLQQGLGDTGTLRLLTAFIVGGVVLQLSLGAVADRTDRQRLMLAVGAGLAIAAVALGAAPGLARYALAFLTGGLVLATYALSLTLLGERFASERLATASAAFLVLYQFGSVGGPVVLGASMGALGPDGFTLGLVMAGVLLALSAALAERPPVASLPR